MKDRATRLQQLADETFDLLIIGGGITGAGAARDAALRGLKVALVDKGDFASGTSSRSAKLVHGGLRYLATFQLGLVRESTSERAVQMRVAPHVVRPIEFLMPVYAEHKHGLGFMNLGLWFYDSLALFRIPRRHRKFRGERALEQQPGLRTEGLRGALLYYDAATDDARLTLENVLDARDLGAVTVNHARVASLLTSDGGRVQGATVQDVLSERTLDVRAHLTVNTTGPWADELLALTGTTQRPLLRPTKGAHLVFRADRLPLKCAVGMIHPGDGRAMFGIPWGSHVYVGTTDIDYPGDLEDVHAAADDVALILEVANHYFPEAGLTTRDIVGSWCGVRPLVAPDESVSASRVSREHVLTSGENGLLTMTGGKLTTYRLMARELVSRAVKLLRRAGQLPDGVTGCRTRKRPLPGARGLKGRAGVESLATELHAAHGVGSAVARHLAGAHGVHARQILEGAGDPADLEPICPPSPVLWAEVDHAVQHEAAATLSDFFCRRTQLSLRDPEGSLAAAEGVARRMARLLEWSEERRAADQAAFQAEIESSLRCRVDLENGA